MFEKLEILQMAQAMAKHASARQSLVSQNIANADTPEYRARDVATFADTYEQQSGWAGRATREGHFAGSSASAGSVDTAGLRSFEREEPGTQSPNGNTVSLELEMLNAVDVKRQHDRALTVYKYSLDMMRTALGRGR
jgi:flagellar basal-body rod protein FlgB